MNSIVPLTNLIGQVSSGAQSAAFQPALPSDGLHWWNLIDLSFRNGDLVLTFGPIVVVVAILALAWFAYRTYQQWKLRPSKWDTTSIMVKYGLFEQEIKPNNETVRIAYQAWVEITTRKVGLPFDDNHDVIVEVYNSWYEVFRVLRDLAKSVPAHRLRDCPNTQKLVEILLQVLNKGLRPHLTQWQAKFRRWYDAAKEKPDNNDKTPQEIQRQFSDYDALVTDLKNVSAQFVTFAQTLKDLAEGKR